ncbi:MAG TPA: response regulator [Usitatibacteraceae bacterium]|nr:response regulator [Usitatibacteraceae bacterium]
MSSTPGPAHPEDPYDLDFTSLVEEPSAPPVPPAVPTPEHEEIALIGANALGEDGFHVVLVRPRVGSSSNQVIMIVDDDEPTAELAALVLRKAGYRTVVALGARDAARLMSRLGAPELLLLDVEMPEMGGLEFLARIRRHKRLSTTPVVLFTAHSSQDDIMRGLQAGADGYIAKPIAASALVSAVETVLGH